MTATPTSVAALEARIAEASAAFAAARARGRRSELEIRSAYRGGLIDAWELVTGRSYVTPGPDNGIDLPTDVGLSPRGTLHMQGCRAARTGLVRRVQLDENDTRSPRMAVCRVCRPAVPNALRDYWNTHRRAQLNHLRILYQQLDYGDQLRGAEKREHTRLQDELARQISDLEALISGIASAPPAHKRNVYWFWHVVLGSTLPYEELLEVLPSAVRGKRPSELRQWRSGFDFGPYRYTTAIYVKCGMGPNGKVGGHPYWLDGVGQSLDDRGVDFAFAGLNKYGTEFTIWRSIRHAPADVQAQVRNTSLYRVDPDLPRDTPLREWYYSTRT